MDDNLQNRIINDTVELFMRHGLRSVRMDDIATSLCISKRTLYEQFESRENLIWMCIKHHHKQQENYRKSQMNTSNNVIEEFIIIFEQWEQTMTDNFRFMQDLNRYYPQLYRKLIDEHRSEHIQYMISGLERGIEIGIFMPGINTLLSSNMLSTSLQELFLNSDAYGKENMSLTYAFKYIVLYFFRGISTEKGRILIDKHLEKHYK